MSDKLSTAEIAAIVNEENFGYAIDYLESDRIIDPELVELWDKAKSAMDNIERFFERRLGKNWDTKCYELMGE